MSKPTNLAETFQQHKADYDMSRQSRFIRRRTGLAPQGGGADYHYRLEQKYYEDIEKARDMDRNDAIVGQIIDRAVSNIVQTGFSLDPKTGDKRIDAMLKSRWANWAKDPDECDISGEFTWLDMERLAMRSTLLDGDIVSLGLSEGSLQLIEGHQVQTKSRQNDTILGVTIDQYRRRQQYWIMRDGLTPLDQKEESKPVSVRDEDGHRVLFHVYNPHRATQTRGVTALAPIFALSGMFEDINFAKLVQQQIVSCWAVFVEQAPGVGGDPPSTDNFGRASTETTAEGTRQLDNVSPGMIHVGKKGQKITGFSPNTPNAEFFSHVRLMLQLIGSNLGLPLSMVLLDGTEGTFSGQRSAEGEARRGFRVNQTNLKNRFHEPVYRWKVRQWMEDDPALKAAAKRSKVNVLNHVWNAPTWQYIEPVKDAQGDALQLKNTLTSPRRLHSDKGRSWEDISNETIEDNAIAILKAKKQAKVINAKYPDDPAIQWRELISLPMPEGVQMTLQDPLMIEAQENNNQGGEQ